MKHFYKNLLVNNIPSKNIPHQVLIASPFLAGILAVKEYRCMRAINQ